MVNNLVQNLTFDMFDIYCYQWEIGQYLNYQLG